jgi:hypothetical protein
VTTATARSPLIRALMRGAIDYAGLFPPASLTMADAVARYAAHRLGDDAWMLGRFIVPITRVDEFAAARRSAGDRLRSDATEWPASAIAKATDAPAIADFNARHAGVAKIDAIETPPVSPADVAPLGAIASTYAVFAEINLFDDPGRVIAALKDHGVRGKIRTGGVTADAIPSPALVARAIVAFARAGVPFKATAGLHHAWRGAYPLTYAPNSVRGTMFGFMNVLLASAAAVDGADEREVEGVLACPGHLAVDAHGMALPSGRRIAARAIDSARSNAITSFGSCSFDEPVAELGAVPT